MNRDRRGIKGSNEDDDQETEIIIQNVSVTEKRNERIITEDVNRTSRRKEEE